MIDRLQAGMYNLGEFSIYWEVRHGNEYSLVSSRYACDVRSSVCDDCRVFGEPYHKDNQ